MQIQEIILRGINQAIFMISNLFSNVYVNTITDLKYISNSSALGFLLTSMFLIGSIFLAYRVMKEVSRSRKVVYLKSSFILVAIAIVIKEFVIFTIDISNELMLSINIIEKLDFLFKNENLISMALMCGYLFIIINLFIFQLIQIIAGVLTIMVLPITIITSWNKENMVKDFMKEIMISFVRPFITILMLYITVLFIGSTDINSMIYEVLIMLTLIFIAPNIANMSLKFKYKVFKNNNLDENKKGDNSKLYTIK